MKKIFLLFTGILLFIANIGFASTPTKLYRNQQWQFSVQIPVEFEYVASRGPNVIMTSANKSHLVSKASINIIAKLLPEADYGTEMDILKTISEMNHETYNSNKNMQLVSSNYLQIPNHVVLAEHVLTKYTYPDETFYLRSYMFTIVCGRKVFTLTYAADPYYFFTMYDKKFINSLSSFVDETGWY